MELIENIYRIIETGEHKYMVECKKAGVPNPIRFKTLMGAFTFIVLMTFSVIIIMTLKVAT